MDQPIPERERIASFEQMKVWQEAHAMVLKVFEVTPRIPNDQQEAIAGAMERTAIEVPKNIAEGFRRRGPRNKAHYYNMAQSALESLRYYAILCRDLKFDIGYVDLAQRVEQVSRMLEGLVRAMARSAGHGHGGGGGRRRRGRGGHGGQGGGGRGPDREPMADMEQTAGGESAGAAGDERYDDLDLDQQA